MHDTMDEIDTRVLCVFHSISQLLYAVLALGSATCNTKNLMSVTPVSARVARYRRVHRGAHYA